jgi:hypothetical protein
MDVKVRIGGNGGDGAPGLHWKALDAYADHFSSFRSFDYPVRA